MDTAAHAGHGQRAGVVALLIGLLIVALHLASRGGDFWGSSNADSSDTNGGAHRHHAHHHNGSGAPTLAPLGDDFAGGWQAVSLTKAPKTAPPPPATPAPTEPPIELPPPMGDAVARRDAFARVSRDVDVDAAGRVRRMHADACGPIGNKFATAVATGATVVNVAHTVRMARPGWFRLFVAAEVGGQRACRGGDVIEASMESADSRVHLDTLVDHGDGLYEAHVFLRRPGTYAVCTDAVVSYAANTAADTQQVRNARFTPDMFAELPKTRIDTTSREVQGKAAAAFCNVAGSWERARCVNITVEMPAAAVAAFDAAVSKQRKASGGQRCTHPDAFRAGEWRRIGRCDDDVCAGDLRAVDVSDNDGWVWASDRCTLRIFDRSAAWAEAAGGRWVVGWGDSTLKQPLANMVEYALGVPVFKADMEHLESVHPAKKRPGFFSYRQYQVSRDPPPGLSLPATAAAPKPFSLSYGWGGCPNIGAPPNCPRHMGMRNREAVARYMGVPLHADAAAATSTGTTSTTALGMQRKVVPDVVILNHFIWRAPLLNETEFLTAMHDTVAWLHATLKAKVRDAASGDVQMPLLVWVTGVRRVHGESSRAYRCTTEDTNAFERHLVWLVEHELTTTYPMASWDRAAWLERPAVLVMSRHELTMPFHTGDLFGHFGVHYGATKGMCLTGISHKQAYELSRCLRRTYVDGMLIQWWLNAMHALGTTAAAADAAGR